MNYLMKIMPVAFVIMTLFYIYGVKVGMIMMLIAGLSVIVLTPYVIAMYFFMAWTFGLYKRKSEQLAILIANNKKLEDTIASHLYFMSDMGPSVSSVSVVALFVSTDASSTKLTLMFFFGILMKYVARKMRQSFYDVLARVRRRR